MGDRRNPFVPAAAALLLLLVGARAADETTKWPDRPRRDVLTADIPGTAAQAISIQARKNGTVVIGWLGLSYDAVVVQMIARGGAPLWGAAGVTLRSGIPCFPAGDSRIHTSGPMDLLPAPRGGLWAAWTEGSGARELRIQRLDAGGSETLATGGATLFTGVPNHPTGGYVGSADAAVQADGRYGLHVVAVTAGDGGPELRYRHVPANSRDGETDRDLLLDGEDGSIRYPRLAALPDGSLAILWWHDASWRMQILTDGDRTLGSTGVSVKGGAFPEPAAVRGTGIRSAPLVLLSLRTAGKESRLLLLDAAGSALRDESSFPSDAGLGEAPEIATIGGLRGGLPEGIDLHGLVPGDPRTGKRAVRLPDGSWDGPYTVDPPLSVGSGQTGSVGGPLWFWDLSNGNYGRLVGYRETRVGRDLVPRLGPWMAFCPGADDGSRMSLQGPWIYLTWVQPYEGTVRAARNLVKRTGRERPIAPHIESARVANTTVAADLEHMRVQRPKSEGDLRLLIGGETGVIADLVLLNVASGVGDSWIAQVGDSNGPGDATLEYHPDAGTLVIRATGVPLGFQNRALYLRVVIRDVAWSGTVVLKPLASGGGDFVPGE